MSTLLHYQAMAYEALLADAKLAAGIGHTPQAGCQITMMALGETEVPCEYEYERGQRGTYDCEEIPPSVAIVSVFIGNHWLDASDVLADCVLERWSQTLVEQAAEEVAA